jgi:hypothetical protein
MSDLCVVALANLPLNCRIWLHIRWTWVCSTSSSVLLRYFSSTSKYFAINNGSRIAVTHIFSGQVKFLFHHPQLQVQCNDCAEETLLQDTSMGQMDRQLKNTRRATNLDIHVSILWSQNLALERPETLRDSFGQKMSQTGESWSKNDNCQKKFAKDKRFFQKKTITGKS